MSFPAPFDRFRGEVLPEWIDYNGHMNLAYYTVLFDQATDLLFDELGLGLDYRRDRKLGTFVAETHNLYERELLVGAGCGSRRRSSRSTPSACISATRCTRSTAPAGQRTATQELMFLHVDLAARRVCPFPPDMHERVAEAAAAHAGLPCPAWSGRRIAMSGR